MSILRVFKRLTIDNDENCVEAETTDGTIYKAAESRLAELNFSDLRRDFRRVTFVPASGTVVMTTPHGDELVVEVFRGEDQFERRAGRPVVYLDQNKWVALACAVHSPNRLIGPELDAAQEVIELARQRRLILPLSSGHLIETGRCDREWRQHLAPLMVSLSRGWLMTDPILVRRLELQALFASRADNSSSPSDVITLNPARLYPENLLTPRTADLPEELGVLSDTLSSVTSIYAALLENEVLDSVAGFEAAASWAHSHQNLATELRSNTRARQLSREVTRARFLTDLGDDLHQAVLRGGVTVQAFGEWLAESAEHDLASSPYLGRMRDVIHFRLRNAGDTWEPNDLIDMLYLPCAAAYADIVVCERKTGDYLRRAQRTRIDGARVLTSFVDLVHLLNEMAALNPVIAGSTEA